MRPIALVSLLCLAVVGTAKGEDGMTPLHHAAQAGDIAAIEALLAGGANVNAKAEYYGATPLHDAAAHGSPSAVEALLAGGANVHAKNEGGATPLHVAAFPGSPSAIEALLAGGANVNAKTEDGRHAAPRGSALWLLCRHRGTARGRSLRQRED